MQIKLWLLSCWLCYQIKLPDSQLPSKALTMFPQSRIKCKFLNQKLWICHSPFIQNLLKRVTRKATVVLWAESKLLKSYGIHEVNFCHMLSMLVALVLLQYSHKKKKTQPWCFTSPVYEQKSSHVILSSFRLFVKTFRSPRLKSLSCCKIGSRVLDGWYYIGKYQRKKVAGYCYEKLTFLNRLTVLRKT